MNNKPNRFKVGDRVTYNGSKFEVIRILSSGKHLNYCLLRKLTGYNIGNESSYCDQFLEYDKEFYRNKKLKEILND